MVDKYTAILDTDKDSRVSLKELKSGLNKFFIVDSTGCVSKQFIPEEIVENLESERTKEKVRFVSTLAREEGEVTDDYDISRYIGGPDQHIEEGVYSPPILVDVDSSNEENIKTVPHSFHGSLEEEIDMDELSSVLAELQPSYKEERLVYKRLPDKKEGIGEVAGIADLPEMIRYDIPLLFKYMRGLVDIAEITVYVNLNEYTLQNEYKQITFSTVCNTPNCFYFWIPILDMECPTIEQLITWIKICIHCRENNLKMVYHCGSGDGRTGYMTLCNLLYYMFSTNPEEGLKLIQEVKDSVPTKLNDWDTLVARLDVPIPDGQQEFSDLIKEQSEMKDMTGTATQQQMNELGQKIEVLRGKFKELIDQREGRYIAEDNWERQLGKTKLYTLCKKYIPNSGLRELFDLTPPWSDGSFIAAYAIVPNDESQSKNSPLATTTRHNMTFVKRIMLLEKLLILFRDSPELFNSPGDLSKLEMEPGVGAGGVGAGGGAVPGQKMEPGVGAGGGAVAVPGQKMGPMYGGQQTMKRTGKRTRKRNRKSKRTGKRTRKHTRKSTRKRNRKRTRKRRSNCFSR